MRRRHGPTEQKVLMGAVHARKQKVRLAVLRLTEVDLFGLPESKGLRKRYDYLLQNGKTLGSLKDMRGDPGLSKEEAKFLWGLKEIRREVRRASVKQMERWIDDLKKYRRAAIIHDSLKKVSRIMEKRAGEVEVDEVAKVYEETLVAIRDQYEYSPLHSTGYKVDLGAVKDRINKRLSVDEGTFISTGSDAIDFHLGGYRRGHLIVYSGKAKSGKSAVVLNLATDQFFEKNLNVLYCTLEMDADEVFDRIWSRKTKIPYSAINTQKGFGKKERRMVGRFEKDMYLHGKRNKCRFSVWDVAGLKFTPQQLQLGVSGLHYDCIIVDYLTLMHKPQRMDLWTMQMEYSRQFKHLAKMLNCVIIVLTQLNKEDEVKYGTAVQENLNAWFRWKWEEEEKETGKTDLELALCRYAAPARFPMSFALSHMAVNIFPPQTVNPNADNSDTAKRKGVLHTNEKDFERGRW